VGEPAISELLFVHIITILERLHSHQLLNLQFAEYGGQICFRCKQNPKTWVEWKALAEAVTNA